MAEDWLPHEPPPPPAASSSRRTLLVWLVLIVVFVAIYALVDRSDAPPSHRAAAGYPGWYIALAFVGGVALSMGALVWLFGHSQRFNQRQREGFAAATAGDYPRAAAIFGELARRFHAKVQFATVAAYQQGYALIRAGDSAAAVGALLAIERRPNLGTGHVRTLAAAELARAFALGGDLDKANRWLEAARARPSDDVQVEAQVAAAVGLVQCRAGTHEAALRHYEQSWPRLEARLTVREMREAWLLRAFALASTRGPRDGAAADPWIRMLWSTPPGQLDWLTSRWPELAMFAATAGIAASAGAAPRERTDPLPA